MLDAAHNTDDLRECLAVQGCLRVLRAHQNRPHANREGALHVGAPAVANHPTAARSGVPCENRFERLWMWLLYACAAG